MKPGYVRQLYQNYPELLISGTIAFTTLFCALAVNAYREPEPFNYRDKYTVWRKDDPRAIEMVKRMKEQQWKPLRRLE